MTITDTACAAFLLRPAGQIASWNAACQNLLGYAGAQVLQRPLASLMAAPARQLCAQRLALARHGAAGMDAELLGADGTAHSLALSFAPQFGRTGKLNHISVVLTAASAPAQSEREMLGRTPLNDMVDFLAGIFYIIDPDGRLVMWNKRLERATQHGATELRGANVLGLFGDEERSAVAAKIQGILEHDGEEVVEAHLRAKDGSSTPYVFSGALLHSRRQSYVCGMGLNISELRRQQEQLRLRERALHASGNGVVITRCAGADNPIEYVNLAYERITGYPAAEVLGRDPRFLAAPGVDAAEHGKLRAAILERRECTVLFRNVRKNGELFWNSLTVTPVRNEKGVATHFIGVVNDVTASIHHTSHLEYALNHDVLTGLASRNLLWDRLDQALHLAQRNHSLVAIILIDLDNFKDINDTLGHDGGDEVLRVVARRLQASVRDTDTVARLGGDEFVLVLDNQPSLRFTLRMIERLRQNMAMSAVVAGKEIGIRTSMGVSLYPRDGAAALELIQAADVAMYHAKAAGRNDVHFFSSDMRLSSEAKVRLENSLRDALARDELFLVFQPRLDLHAGRVVGAEALLRWRHPERGVLLPAAFLPEAEESGLIIALGEWVFARVCATLQRLQGLGFGALTLSMNASFPELNQKNYLARIGEQLRARRLRPDAFELEVKEAHLLRNPQLTLDLFKEIARLGIRLAIDDFGAGVSSLGNLQKSNIAHLKIPRDVVARIGGPDGDGLMAKTLIGIGRTMRIGVVAEGVETDAQLAFLKDNECDEMQGNYFSEPIALPAFEQLLREGAGRGAAHRHI